MKVTIVGGGIGGLTAAIAMRQRGIETTVFEAAHELSEVGAGITVPANALQILDRLGLVAQVVRQGRLLRRGEVRDARDGLLQRVEMEPVQRRFGHGMVGIHRARLQRVLSEALPTETIRFGKPFVNAEPTAGGVLASFADGSEEQADLVVGADGLRSAVRTQLFPEARIRYSGQTSYRGIARYALPVDIQAESWEVWGPGRRFGFVPISPDEVYWFAVLDAPSGGSDPAGGALPRVESLFVDFPDPIPEIISRTPAEAVLRTDISDLRPLDRWSRGRVVLLGDAAHATTPNLGQGGAQAIEDAWVLADRLAALPGDVDRAFAEYESIRRPKASRIVRTSWWFGKLAHLRNPAARSLRNALIRRVPPSSNERQLQAIFELGY